MEHLIVKYLNNELDHEEWLELRAWLDESALNRMLFNKLISISSNITCEADELEDLVWQELKRRRDMREVPMVRNGQEVFRNYLKVAAVMLVASAALFLIWRVYTNDAGLDGSLAENMIIKETLHGQKITTQLPDGSVVTLNSGSRISFPGHFGDTREVELSGEAFFEVERNPRKPFHVKMNGGKVSVLGTSFNIRSYADEKIAQVAVATGKVSYSVSSGEKVILEPDQMASHSPGMIGISVSKVDRLRSFGWKDQIIYFKSTAFSEVITELERWYGVEIRVYGDFQVLGPFTGEFHNESLSQVLKGLSYVYPFNYQIEENKVTLRKTQPKSGANEKTNTDNIP